MHLRIAPAPNGGTRPCGGNLRGARRALFVLGSWTSASVLVGCVGELPPAAPGRGSDFSDLPDLRTEDARPQDARLEDARVPDGDLDLGPATDADPVEIDLGDALVPSDAQILDFNPIPDFSPTDEGVLDLVGVPDTYLLSGACPLTVGAENGLLANDGVPAGTTVEVDQFNAAGAMLVRLDPDGGFLVEPGGVANIRFSYRLVVEGVRSAPITVDLRQPDNAIIVNTTSDNENETGGLCSLRSAVRAANENLAVQGCTAGRGADTIVFATPETTITLTDGPPRPPQAPPLRPTAMQVTRESVAILGCGGDLTAIDAAQSGRHFEVAAGARLDLSSLTLRNGEQVASPGGALRVLGTVELANVIVETSSNTGPMGGLGFSEATGANAGGGGGGGGGAGIGGAVFVGNGGRFTAYGTPDTCSFLNNVAQGGRGGGGIGANGATQGRGGNGAGNGGAGGVPGQNPTGADGGSGGGGGGGAGVSAADGNGMGGRGGFGGGGGGTGARMMSRDVGIAGTVGGFGGGAGGSRACFRSGPGGGGGAFGGAIYSDNGVVDIRDCRFAGNQVLGGAAGLFGAACADVNVVPIPAQPGHGVGASIFARGPNAQITITRVVTADGPDAVVNCNDPGTCGN